MKAEDFAKLYEAYRRKALDVIYKTGFKSASLAEDAVQNAALYFLECRYGRRCAVRKKSGSCTKPKHQRLSSYDRITASLFCEIAVKRIHNLRDQERGARSGNPLNREVGVGTSIDLADLEDPYRWAAPEEE